jgi:AAA domain
MKLTDKTIADLLPDEPLEAKIDPSNLVIFLIAPPKWGKTSFFMSNPNCLHLGFEEGAKFQRGFKIAIDKWDSNSRYANKLDRDGVMHMTAMQALQQLQNSSKFNFVAIDTVDMATKQCTDWFCEEGGKEHIGDLGDYGKGYDIGQNAPMRKFILGILKTGRGVGLISHSKTTLEKFTSGEKARKESTLPSGVKKLCETQADIIMHGEYGNKQPGAKMRDRVLVCEGDMDIQAGNRSGAMLPARYVLSRTKQWDQFVKFFTDPEAEVRETKRYKILSAAAK